MLLLLLFHSQPTRRRFRFVLPRHRPAPGRLPIAARTHPRPRSWLTPRAAQRLSACARRVRARCHPTPGPPAATSRCARPRRAARRRRARTRVRPRACAARRAPPAAEDPDRAPRGARRWPDALGVRDQGQRPPGRDCATCCLTDPPLQVRLALAIAVGEPPAAAQPPWSRPPPAVPRAPHRSSGAPPSSSIPSR